eukprot:TRINITY_DN36135_c0_g1_i1.p1 TRINITY_DN36135_c0_g1~~TRINITY_DN36135_c0_g1_i1.p1  ORF type:complete len:247 (-),score=27.78 TRINITY_DN36135_c0_g1_i1:54-737(-)
MSFYAAGPQTLGQYQYGQYGAQPTQAAYYAQGAPTTTLGAAYGSYGGGCGGSYAGSYAGGYGADPAFGSSQQLGGGFGQQTYGAVPVGTSSGTAPGGMMAAQELPQAQSMLVSAPSMVVSAPAMNPLQSTPSMVAYPGFGASPYVSAMDGPFKFYATPPGKLGEAGGSAAGVKTAEGGAQTGASLSSAGMAAELDRNTSERAAADSSSKTSKKYTSARKKKSSLGCC